MKQWKRIDPTTVTKVGWRTVVTKTFTMPDGKSTTIDTFHKEGTEIVVIIGLTPDKQVIVARQFRFGPEKVFDELPGGFVDEGEDTESAAKREFLEETGYQVGHIEYLGVYHKDNYMNAIWHVYLATDCTRVAKQNLEAEEDIKIRLISIDQLIENGKTDKMTDVTAVLMAYDRLRR